ncbi:MAG: hypothetical protein K2R93_16025 [Gemmatimonadaceae bacterium]|nr:hypothetical protein [Gemmatimonadaceae bacterium]
MIALGLRAHPKHVTFAVVANPEAPVLQALSTVILPAALHAPEQLFFVRTTLLDLIREYHVTSAGVRTTEPMAKSPNLLRLNIEGVVQELLGAGAVPRYFAGPLATIGRYLGVSTKEAKRFATGEARVDSVEGWAERYDDEQREAILAALAALRIPRSRLSMMTDDAPVALSAGPADLEVPHAD